MKRKLILLAALLSALMFTVPTSLADTWYTISAPVTSGTGLSATEWYSSAKMRAMLTLSLSIDTISELSDADSDSYTSFWFNSSWVGISKSRQQVMVAGYYSTSTKTTILVMVYTPSTGKIDYMPIVSSPALSDANAELICEAAFTGDGNNLQYEKNDLAEIISIIADLQ